MPTYRQLAVMFATALALPHNGVAQGNVDRGGFVVCLGDDTLAVERYTRSATSLESEIVVKVPASRRVNYIAGLDTLGAVRSFTVTMYPLVRGPRAAEPSRGSLWFRGDTAELTLAVGDTIRTLKIPARPGSVPLAGFSHALVEQAILHARHIGRDSFAFDWVGVGAPKAYPTFVSRHADGLVMVGFFDAPALATVDPDGRMLALDGRATTAKVEVHRVTDPDLEHFARSFADAEKAQGPAGMLSPRDTAFGVIEGTHVMVDYGSPRKRGRVVFGQVVPWHRVWRTGANGATELFTDGELVGDGWTIPPGRYSLWSIPTPTGGTLIVNRRTGQWGTQYDPDHDLARIPLVRESLTAPQEPFTIAIEPTSEGGAIRLSWDTTSFVAPFRIAGR